MIFQNFGFNRLILAEAGSGYDPDAQAFITATGISGSTADAVNQLVLDLKSYSLWTNMNVIYPLVGGTSSSTSYNLKNTAQYQIVWSGSVSYASTGVTGDGSTGYGNTGLNPNVSGLFTAGTHLSTYIRTTGNSAAYDIGANEYPYISPTNEWMVARFGNDRYTAFGQVVPGNPYVTSTGGDITGLFVGTSDGTTTTLYLDGSSLISDTKTYGIANNNLYILARSGTNLSGIDIAVDYSSREYAWFSVGQPLNSTEVSNLNTAVTTFQTSLSRNV